MTVDGPFPSRPGFSAFTVKVVDNRGSGVDRFEYFPVLPDMPVDCRTGSSTYFGGALVGRAVVADVHPDPAPAVRAFTVRTASVARSTPCWLSMPLRGRRTTW